MSRLRIDFAAPGLRRTLYRTHTTAWALALFALSAAASVGGLAWTLYHEQRGYEAQLASVVRRVSAASAAPARVSAPPIPEGQAAAVNAVVLQLNLPWRDLRDAVAQATPPAIALLALEPDARKHTLRITAEARAADGMIGYIEELKKQELFANVALMHHETNDTDPNRPLRFQLEAQWVSR